ncbi:hypothetical protein P3T27_000710 [Kitasatospora sp. MAA19]|nr:hypothetical protein [Kitasatospora sp. MAA19]
MPGSAAWLIQRGMDDETLTPIDRMLAERACERIVVDFIHRLDLGEPGSVAELFTPDGVWSWPHGDRRVEGREALRAYFASRPADRLSRRLMTNILVTVESATTARAVSYLTTYRVDGYAGGMIEPRLPANVGHYEDTFRAVDGSWLLATRTVFLPFGADTARLPAAG